MHLPIRNVFVSEPNAASGVCVVSASYVSYHTTAVRLCICCAVSVVQEVLGSGIMRVELCDTIERIPPAFICIQVALLHSSFIKVLHHI